MPLSALLFDAACEAGRANSGKNDVAAAAGTADRTVRLVNVCDIFSVFFIGELSRV